MHNRLVRCAGRFLTVPQEVAVIGGGVIVAGAAVAALLSIVERLDRKGKQGASGDDQPSIIIEPPSSGPDVGVP